MEHDLVAVTSLEFLGGHRVRLTFSDGAERDRDLHPLLRGPVFETIRADQAEFDKVDIDPQFGVLCWPNGADIDAELLRYDDLWEATISLARAS